jgi:hypothetical protein
MADMVKMTHPDIDGVAGPVTREAFDEIWAAKGWVLAEADQQSQPAAQPPNEQGAQ